MFIPTADKVMGIAVIGNEVQVQFVTTERVPGHTPEDFHTFRLSVQSATRLHQLLSQAMADMKRQGR